MATVIQHKRHVLSRPRSAPLAGSRPRRQPRYVVILWNDDHHTYQYVVAMLRELFGLQTEAAFQIARTVDTAGRAVCYTTTREHAELKRDQIHAFGRDCAVPDCRGSMKASIEPLTDA